MRDQSSVGKTFGYLTVLSVDPNQVGKTKSLVRCVCGHEKLILTCDVLNGRTKSCGCKRAELRRISSPNVKWGGKVTHGLSRSRIHRVYANMVDRCHNPRNYRAKDYGNRGIKVCDEWRNDFTKFVEWANENGYSDELQLDRIDNDKGYQPDNCRFLTCRENMKNQRNSVLFLIDGEKLNGRDIEERYGIKRATFRHRIEILGYSPEQALIAKPLRGAAAAKLKR